MTLWRRWRTRLMLFLAVLGPGFITANVDNDSGGILTYSQAGAQYGYKLLWTMIPITLALIVVQEMCARMGVVTGKGLSDLIREEFGLRITFVVMILLVIVNFGNVMAEFSGIAGSMQLFHLSKYISVPVCAFIVWILVVKGDYKSVEKVFLLASVVYIAYIFAGGLFNASLFAASILPLSTAYTVCEGLGFESGLDKSFGEARFFYWFYTLLLALGAGVVLIPNFPLIKVIIGSQVLNGVLLPV